MDSLTVSRKQTCLETLTATRLRQLVDAVGASPSSRRAKSELVAALADGAVDFTQVLGLLKLAELKSACGALEVEVRGRTKEDLVEALLASDSPAQRRSPSTSPPPMSARSAGSLKSALRRFVLETAGGYRGRDAARDFTANFLRCFGWDDGRPPEATMPASLAIVDEGQRTTREVPLLWRARRVLVEVVQHDVMLDFAWKGLMRACLQLDPVPQYVILTNQRDLHLYDLAREHDAPRLSIPLDDLPKYSEAFPFLSAAWVPGTTPKIINVSKVSREVADLVAKLYRSLKQQHPRREGDVVKFTLQCIIAMFAEDIGLLPQSYFTTLLYEGARARDVERRLRGLFGLMSTKEVPAPRPVPFFNGGLFSSPVTLSLGDAQLTALTKASESNWTYVDPHIFGSVFQGIMNDAERHASGAHYTAHDDIMRVVGPTIVEPWRQQIRNASTLSDLLEVRAALLKFRVLDPACGSGNFLYVAFRELYRLDTELLARIREFPSTQGQGKARVRWGVGIQTANFFGLDINPFAVELAKVTLNIAKKIAFDERREMAADFAGQMELDVDPSLPLDNLDKNIVCADALFTDWPEVDSIVGNPPILGDRKLRRELGANYIQRLHETSGVDGVVDLSCYWFRRAHDRLAPGARAGLVGTSGIRVGKAREASLDYIVAQGGTITNAVSSRLWPGDAALNVSMVNWVKGPSNDLNNLIVEDHVYPMPRIPTHLQLHSDASDTEKLKANKTGTAMGVIFGSDAFRATGPLAFPIQELRGKPFVKPVATGDDMLRGLLSKTPDYCIHLTADTEKEAERVGGRAFLHLKKHVYPMVKDRAESGEETHHYERWLRTWWQPREPSHNFFSRLSGKSRMIACSNPQARPIFAFISCKFVPTNTMQVFAFDDDYSFGVIQSSLHWLWIRAKGGKVTERIRYTNDVWRTFPWPQDPPEEAVVAVASAARNFRQVRSTLMAENGWSLRALYQAAEVPGPHPLKEAQAALDEVVDSAYGRPNGEDAVAFLLELNGALAEDEGERRLVQGPGLPAGFTSGDSRWRSDDCIEPPSS